MRNIYNFKVLEDDVRNYSICISHKELGLYKLPFGGAEIGNFDQISDDVRKRGFKSLYCKDLKGVEFETFDLT